MQFGNEKTRKMGFTTYFWTLHHFRAFCMWNERTVSRRARAWFHTYQPLPCPQPHISRIPSADLQLRAAF